MSGFGSVFALLTAVPLTFGATRRIHDRLRARWNLRNHVPFDLEADEGDLVFASGVVRALDETVIAPLSGRACVAYRSRVRTSASLPNWRETTQLRPFLLEGDDGDSVVIAGDRVMFALSAIPLGARDRDRERSFLARHALASGSMFSEVVVEVGATVLVGGTLVLEPCDAPPTEELGFRDPPQPDPLIVGNRVSPLVIVSHER